MTFRKASNLLLPLLLFVLAWALWDPGTDTPLEIPEDRSQAEEGPRQIAVAQAGHDGLLHAPMFRVTILDERGLPLAGAQVQVCGSMEPPEVLAQGHSDGVGNCELQPERAACSHRYRVRARIQDGFPWTLSSILDPGPRALAEVPALRISRPAKIQGRVVDAQQTALSGIEVVFVEGASLTILGDEKPGRRVRSGPAGAFTLLLPAGRPQQIRVLGSERLEAPAQAPRTFRPGLNRLTLELRELPESDLELRFWTWMRRPHPGVRQETRPGKEPLQVHLQACADLPLPSVILEKDIEVPKTGRVDIFMPQGSRLALQPRPLLPGTERVQVRFEFLGASGRRPQHPLDGPGSGRFEADLVQGQVLLQELRPGKWRFWIEAPGWPESGAVEVDLGEDLLRPVRVVRLVGPCQLMGSLLDADSKPVAGRLLRLYAIDKGTKAWLVQIRTDSHGEFRFLGLPLCQYQLWSRDPQGQESRLAEGRLQSGQNPPLRLLFQK